MASTHDMKFSSKIYLLVILIAAVCIGVKPLLSYRYGYDGSPTSLLAVFAALRLCRFLSFVILLVALKIEIQKRKHYLASASILVAFIALNIAGDKAFESSAIILRGMENRILKSYTLSEIRAFAREFDQLPYLSGSNSTASKKIYSDRDLASAGLIAKFPFLSCLNKPTAIENGDVVCVMGGRPLKAIYINVDGTEISSVNYSASKSFGVSNDIAFAVRID